MAATNQNQGIKDLQSRLDWFDQERRKQNRKVAELEQKLELQTREIDQREQRIQALEQQLAGLNAKTARIPQIDVQLAQFKDEIIKMVEQYDQRRIQSEAEMDRLRRVEQEGIAREIADVRKDLVPIPRLQNDMELRQAEEARLANIVGQIKTDVEGLRNRLETWDTKFAFLEEKEKHNSRNIADLQNSVVEINRRWEHVHGRLDTLNSSLLRLESNMATINEQNEAIKDSTKNWMEQIQLGEYERNQKVEKWRQMIEEQLANLSRYDQEWIKFSDQYKEAKMAVDTLSQWQEQMENQQREAAELLRLESQRMQGRWDDFLTEEDKKWKSLGVDTEQRWATLNRHIRDILEQVTLIEENVKVLEQDKDLLWRVQSAQADALKQFPLTWLEEVEKVIQQNPNRRRQPALVPVREEFD